MLSGHNNPLHPQILALQQGLKEAEANRLEVMSLVTEDINYGYDRNAEISADSIDWDEFDPETASDASQEDAEESLIESCKRQYNASLAELQARAEQLSVDNNFLQQASVADVLKLIELFPTTFDLLNAKTLLFRQFNNYDLQLLAEQFPMAANECCQRSLNVDVIIDRLLIKAQYAPNLVLNMLKCSLLPQHFSVAQYQQALTIYLAAAESYTKSLALLLVAPVLTNGNFAVALAKVCETNADLAIDFITLAQPVDIDKAIYLQIKAQAYQNLAIDSHLQIMLNDSDYSRYLLQKNKFPALDLQQLLALFTAYPALIVDFYKNRQVFFLAGIQVEPLTHQDQIITLKDILAHCPQVAPLLLSDPIFIEDLLINFNNYWLYDGHKLSSLNSRSKFIYKLLSNSDDAAELILSNMRLADLLKQAEVVKLTTLKKHRHLALNLYHCPVIYKELPLKDKHKIAEGIRQLNLLQKHEPTLVAALEDAEKFHEYFTLTEYYPLTRNLFYYALIDYPQHQQKLVACLLTYPNEISRLLPNDTIFMQYANLSADIASLLFNQLKTHNLLLPLIKRSCNNRSFHTIAQSLNDADRLEFLSLVLHDQLYRKDVKLHFEDLTLIFNLPNGKDLLLTAMLADVAIIKDIMSSDRALTKLPGNIYDQPLVNFIDLLKLYPDVTSKLLEKALATNILADIGLQPSAITYLRDNLSEDKAKAILNYFLQPVILEKIVTNLDEAVGIYNQLFTEQRAVFLNRLTALKILPSIIKYPGNLIKAKLDDAFIYHLHQLHRDYIIKIFTDAAHKHAWQQNVDQATRKFKHDLSQISFVMRQAQRSPASLFFKLPNEINHQIFNAIVPLMPAEEITQVMNFTELSEQLHKLLRHCNSEIFLTSFIANVALAKLALQKHCFPQDFTFAQYRALLQVHPQLAVGLYQQQLLQYEGCHDLLAACPATTRYLLQLPEFVKQLLADANAAQYLNQFAERDAETAKYILATDELAARLTGDDLLKFSQQYSESNPSSMRM